MNIYLQPFFATQNAVPHVITGPRAALLGVLLALHVEVQSNLGIDSNSEITVHDALLIDQTPTQVHRKNISTTHTPNIIRSYKNTYKGSSSISMSGETAAHRASALASKTLLINPPLSTSEM